MDSKHYALLTAVATLAVERHGYDDAEAISTVKRALAKARIEGISDEEVAEAVAEAQQTEILWNMR